MVNLVLVSHSARLAEGVKELVEQVAQGRVKIFTAGGVDPDTLGTNVEAILQALTEADNPQGTLVLMDLGSAILSAETALEFLPEDVRYRVRFCAAPFVEGAVAAGVQASLGSDLDTVQQEAMHALDPKAEHLDQAAPDLGLPPASLPVGPLPGLKINLTLANLHGLHARPAARLVQTVSSFQAEVTITDLTNRKGPVSARSLNRLATLGAVQGHQIQVQATGPDAEAALSAIQALAEEQFGQQTPAFQAYEPGQTVLPSEKSEPRSAIDLSKEGPIQGVPVAEGFALARAAYLLPTQPAISQQRIENPQEEWATLEHSLEKVRQRIQKRRTRIAAWAGEADASIFDAHLLILQDPELLAGVRTRIFNQKMNATLAWDSGIREVAADYATLADPYLQRRAQDVTDVGTQVLLDLVGQVDGEITFAQPVILVARELTPNQIAGLDVKQVAGLITIQGGPTSHSAILARSLEIPSLTGLPETILETEEGTLLALDGFSGRLWISPGNEVQAELADKQSAWLARKHRLREISHSPAVTLDGQVIEVAANVGGLPDIQLAVQNGADGIGLLRTEFLFLNRSLPPNEQAQVDALAPIFDRMRDRTVIVRTLDAGGDKPLPFLDLPVEANPFLGVRAIRLSKRHPDLLLTQIRAILRAGPRQLTKIMFPMIANLDEVLFGKTILQQAHQALNEEGLAHTWPVETGIMVETPAAALLAPDLALHVDFFSIGTNDLTQYTMAAERGNPELAEYADGLHPAVLQLIQQVVRAAHSYGKWVGVCGELASDPLAVPVLIGLGVHELSLHPGSIPKIKDLIGHIRLEAAASLASQAVKAESAPTVRTLARTFLDTIER